MPEKQSWGLNRKHRARRIRNHSLASVVPLSVDGGSCDGYIRLVACGYIGLVGS